ncbi:hypothetical protein [Chryseobacterium terrae]|uniref:DUF1146 domain-containing protein n=1 Tax=Chryseobacterium terrae TaxID=3163299 RepID=A0ABW8Y3Z9_9FLAO
MERLETFIIYLFIPIVFLLLYYAGFVTMSKLKIKQEEDDLKIHFLRIGFGFISIAIFTAVLLILKWFLKLLLPSIIKLIYGIN